MRKILLLLSFIVFIGCVKHNVGVVGSKRMLISGNILNAENTPIENISLIASGSEYDRLWARPAQMLGETSTNASGKFSFVSLDTHNSFYGVSVNHSNHQDYREEFSTIHFLDSIGSRGNSFELTNIQLPKVQQFQVKLNNTSARNDTLFFEFSYSSTEIYRKLHEDSFDNPLRFQGESEYWNRILPGEDEMTISAKTIENSDLLFYYKFSAETDYDTINVEITPENPVYEFSY